MLIVNLYGATEIEKSTGAWYVLSKLMMLGINAELVTKDKVREESEVVLEDQLCLFSEQLSKISRLRDKVDVIVTDSPLLLSCYYENDPGYGLEFKQLVTKVADSYNHIDFFIRRVETYNPAGRFKSEDESQKISEELVQMLKEYHVPFTTVDGDREGYDKIVNLVKVEDFYTDHTQRARTERSLTSLLKPVPNELLGDNIEYRSAEDELWHTLDNVRIENNPLGVAIFFDCTNSSGQVAHLGKGSFIRDAGELYLVTESVLYSDCDGNPHHYKIIAEKVDDK